MTTDGIKHGAEDAAAQENLSAVRLHYAAYSARNIERLLEGLDEAVAIQVHDEHGVRLGKPKVGLDQARGFFWDILSLVDDSTVEINDLRVDEDRVLARVRLGGTLRDSGRSGSIAAVHLFTVSDGLITGIRTHRPDWRTYVTDS